MIKNLAVGYHIRTVNSLKNLTIELKDLSNTINLNTVTHLNEILTETLKKAENYYSVYINKFPYSKEANNLYSLFMTNIVVNLVFKSKIEIKMYKYIYISKKIFLLKLIKTCILNLCHIFSKKLI